MKSPSTRHLVAVSLLAAAPLGTVQAQELDYEAARSDYEVGHFRRAFDAFAALADAGHCDAARIGREMVRYGPQLYAIWFEVQPDRLARWHAVAPCDGLQDERHGGRRLLP
ncbi:hypothetical protein [Variovorax sp. YR752]|uniref:hypothetical protein n=1 Tax=Variovorax sp. YR752 TaxID=1884383 RepID=UPI003137B470